MKIVNHMWLVEFFNEYTNEWEPDGVFNSLSKSLLLTTFETRNDAREYCRHQNGINAQSTIKVRYRYRKVEYV